MDCKERIICDILSVPKTKSFEKKNDVTLITHRSCGLVHNKMLQEINSKPLPLSDIYDSKKKDAKGGQKNLLFHHFFSNSTGQKDRFTKNLVCLHCRKYYSKGHEKECKAL